MNAMITWGGVLMIASCVAVLFWNPTEEQFRLFVGTAMAGALGAILLIIGLIVERRH